jgi:hypothetical protein
VNGFNRVANYSFSTGFNTRIYGTYHFKPGKKVKAIRHIVNPSVSFGYTPDFTGNQAYFQTLKDPNTQKEIYKSRHEGFLYGGSSERQSGSIGFSLGNNLEAKVQGANDTTARKVMLLNNLSFNTSYNLLADSFNLSPVSIAANTSILNNKVNVNISGSLDPYQYVQVTDESGNTRERRTSNYAFRNQNIGRITSATMALSTNLNPKAQNKETTSREKIAKSDLAESDKAYLMANPDAYVDFEIPWSLSINYSLQYSRPVNAKARLNQTLTGNGDLSISEKWKITYSTGFDLKAKQFTMTNLGIARDLHCWTMRLNWTPFGMFQSFHFTINVKSSLLQDLKLERRKSFMDR